MKHHPYNLKGSSLEVFSALYCLTRKRAFLGTYLDLASWLEIDKNTLRRALKVLQERELVSIEKSISGFDRYEFQAHHIKGYPLPDYKYSGRKSKTDYPVIDAQNLDEYRKEIEATGGVIDPSKNQNGSVMNQNEPLVKESNKENNTNIIYTKKKIKSFLGGKTNLSKKKYEEIKEKIYPPTWEMVREYVETKVPAISLEVAKRWYAYAVSGKWKMTGGRRIDDWHASLYWFDQKRIELEKEKAARKVIQAQAGVSPDVLAIEEQMREQRRREREKMDEEANTPEAKEAAQAFFDKFCKD